MEMNYKYFKLTKINEKYSIDSEKEFLGHIEKHKNGKYIFIPYQYEKEYKEIIWFQECISDLNQVLIELNS